MFHAAVFLSLAAASFVLALTEWQQLANTLTHPFTWGDPPRRLALLGSAGALFFGGMLLVRLARGKAVPLWMSGAILLGSVTAMSAAAQSLPQARSAPGANVRVLRQARALQSRALDVLQTEGEVSRRSETWAGFLRGLPKESAPGHDALLRPLAFHVVVTASESDLPRGLAPGMLLVFVSADGAQFMLRAVGFDARGGASVLSTAEGSALVLKGTYRPPLKTDKEGEGAPRQFGDGRARSATGL